MPRNHKGEEYDVEEYGYSDGYPTVYAKQLNQFLTEDGRDWYAKQIRKNLPDSKGNVFRVVFEFALTEH